MPKNDAKRDPMAEAFEALALAIRGVAHTLAKVHPGATAAEAVDFVERKIADAERALKGED